MGDLWLPGRVTSRKLRVSVTQVKVSTQSYLAPSHHLECCRSLCVVDTDELHDKSVDAPAVKVRLRVLVVKLKLGKSTAATTTHSTSTWTTVTGNTEEANYVHNRILLKQITPTAVINCLLHYFYMCS